MSRGFTLVQGDDRVEEGVSESFRGEKFTTYKLQTIRCNFDKKEETSSFSSRHQIHSLRLSGDKDHESFIIYEVLTIDVLLKYMSLILLFGNYIGDLGLPSLQLLRFQSFRY